MAITTTCYSCGSTFSLEERKRCECGEPLWVDTYLETFQPNESQQGLWRYADLLPVDSPVGISVGGGGTPLLPGENLSEYAGCNVYVKDEAEHPTGSFKDRGTAVAVTSAVERGVEWIGTVSTGNMAMSTAAHSASTALECVVLVPSDIPSERVAYISQYAPNFLQIAGDYGQLYYDSLSVGPEVGVEFINGDSPMRIEGYKTSAFEICEQFPGTPDAIVMPVSSGGHASGIWKGLVELDQMGVIDSVPRLHLVQTAAANPIAAAFQAGSDSVDKIEGGETVAYSIGNGDPPSGNRALVAASETGGSVTSVTDREILEARDRLADHGGVCAEPASATSLAGTRKLTAAGEIGSDESVALIVTGTGFKEMGESGAAIEGDVVELPDLKRGLAGLVD